MGVKIPEKLPELVAMVGFPYSGKTTICDKILAPSEYVIVSPDCFRMAMHRKRYLAEAEPFIWASVGLAVDALRIAGHRVVVDACNCTRKRREQWSARGARFLVVDTPREVCVGRAKAANDYEILKAIDRMADAFEPLADHEEAFVLRGIPVGVGM